MIIFCESAALALMQQKLSISLSLSLSTPLLFFYFFNGIAYINIGIKPKSIGNYITCNVFVDSDEIL